MGITMNNGGGNTVVYAPPSKGWTVGMCANSITVQLKDTRSVSKITNYTEVSKGGDVAVCLVMGEPESIPEVEFGYF